MARVTSWEHNRQTFAQKVLKIEKHENKKGDVPGKTFAKQFAKEVLKIEIHENKKGKRMPKVLIVLFF